MKRTLVVSLLFCFVVGCAGGAKTKSAEGSSSGSRATSDCKTCARMCEIGGDAKEDAAGVEKCKDNCKKKCK